MGPCKTIKCCQILDYWKWSAIENSVWGCVCVLQTLNSTFVVGYGVCVAALDLQEFVVGPAAKVGLKRVRDRTGN